MFRPTTLLLLLVTGLVGCNSLGYAYDEYRRGTRADNRGYSQRGYESRSYPSWARTYDKKGRRAYVMCHKGKKTKAVRTNSVRGHLRHGDRFGSCYSDRRYRDRGYGGYSSRGYDRHRRYDDDDDDGYRRRYDDDDDD